MWGIEKNEKRLIRDVGMDGVGGHGKTRWVEGEEGKM